ncbi:MAG: glycoside hydrolase family 127 protein [bacterium]
MSTEYLLVATALIGLSALCAAGTPVTDTSSSPHVELRSVPLEAVRWTEGFWAERFQRCRAVTLPEMERALHHPKNAACLDNFTVAAGLEKGEHRGRNWSDGDCYKFIEALAYVYAVTRDPRLDRLMDKYIGLIAKAQEPDGYICTQVQLTDKKRWQARHHHELYNMGHLLTAACIHHRATGKDAFLAVARKLADYLHGVFQPRPRRLALYGWNPSNIMGLVELYRTTGERRYLELAGIFVDMRGSAPAPKNERHPGDQNQNRVPLRKETQAVGHAVTAAYLYCGAADVVAETGEPEPMAALERIWANVTGRKMYITGGIGALHHGVSERGDKVHEAFGRDYQLPNRTAYNETCANIANAMWNWRMLALTADARYADVMEGALYNAVLAAWGLDGKSTFYTNPLARAGRDVPLLSNDTRQRWEVFKCYCCPPSVARTVAKLGGWAYSMSDEGLWVHLYGANALATKLADGAPLKLEQATAYPWDGKVVLTLEEAAGGQFALRLRIPGWADSATIEVNGKPAAAACEPGSYAAVRRKWHAGDRIELDLPMRVRLVEAHPRVEACRGKVAVMRGPVVYCLESPDLPDGVGLVQVALPADVELAPRHDPQLLGGVTVLEGEARAEPLGSPLYAEAKPDRGRRVAVRLIPYYAWANRGPSEMTVWLPLAP